MITGQEENIELENAGDIEQFKALFNFATIGIIVTDHEGKIININHFAETQFGYGRQDLIGQRVEILLPGSIHGKHEKYREQYYTNPAPRIMGHGRDLYALRKNGDIFPVEVSLSHFMKDDHVFVIAFVIDITVRKSQESALKDQKNELEQITSEVKKMNTDLEKKVDDRTKMLREALTELEKSKKELNDAYEDEKELGELKSRFVTMASHEFRTPLSTILSSSYLLEKYNENEPDEKVAKHLHRIKGAVGGMKSILEDFLSLGKLEEGWVITEPGFITPGELASQLENLMQELEPLLKPGQRIEYENSVGINIKVDKDLLKNILINLLSNAIKFSLNNSIIKLSFEITKDEIKIVVGDKGIGISEDDQQHLFERFFRAKNASNIQGTGLGLHIVAKYLELMKGRIEMKSKLDVGTTFTIYIPNGN